MSADFTPSMGSYHKQNAFKYWVQKVLPLVYDDSLSYYELLEKVVVYLNNTIEDVNQVIEDTEKLHDAYDNLQTWVNEFSEGLANDWEEFRDYVTNYLQNLDVQEEINIKLDRMAEDGTLTNLIRPFLENAVSVQNQRISVLESRMDTFASLPDGSLSTSADAELADIRVGADGTVYPTAGDAVRGQVGDLQYALKNTIDFPFAWEIGTITTNGNDSVADNRVRSGFIPIIANQTTITFDVVRPTGLGFYLFFYDYGKNLLGSNGSYWSELIEPGTKVVVPVASSGYLRINARVKFDSPITDEVLSQVTNSVKINTNIVDSLKNTEHNSDDIAYIEESIVDNLISDVGTWEQGGLTNTGANTVNLNRIRTQGGIYLRKGDSVRFKANGQWYYWHLLQDGSVYKNSSAWITTDSIIDIDRDCYLRITVSKTNQGTPITPEERTVTASIYTAIAKKISGLYKYTGREIDLSNHSYNASVFMTLPSLAGLQGGANYGDEFFLFTNDRNINVYNTSGELQGTFTPPLPESTHGNTLCFADKLHEGNTQYPYLYVSSHYNQNAFFVLDIVKSNGTFTATLVQTIAFNQVSTDIIGLGYSDFAIDWQNNIFYMLRYKLQTTNQAIAGNVQVITAWPLPTVSVGTKLFNNSELLDKFEVPDLIFARQQSLYYRGNIYFPAGSGGVNGRQKLYVLNVAEKSIVTTIDLSEVLNYTEPEALMIYNNKLVIFNTGKNVYQLDFVN